jgi:DNA ligase 1
VNRFAELLNALLFTPSRNGKLRLMVEYFATTPDPERGWALAALTGELSFAEAKPGQVRALAMARVDPELFAWSYDFVGDLAETVSLIWPEPSLPSPPHRPAMGPSLSRGTGEGLMASLVKPLSRIAGEGGEVPQGRAG